MANIYLITGASSELGLTLIKQIYNKEDIFIAHYNRSDDQLKALVAELGDNIKLHQANFENENDTEAFVEEITEIYKSVTHIVHLPAAKIQYQKFAKTSWEQYERDLNVQLRSIYKISQAFIKDMAKRKRGKIVFVLTSAVMNIPPKYLSSYVTTKYSLLGFMKALAVEYAPKKVCVNAVLPTMMETKFLEDIPELAVNMSAKDNPMGRNGKVEDVVPVIELLLREETNYMTGTCIPVAGGSVF